MTAAAPFKKQSKRRPAKIVEQAKFYFLLQRPAARNAAKQFFPFSILLENPPKLKKLKHLFPDLLYPNHFDNIEIWESKLDQWKKNRRWCEKSKCYSDELLYFNESELDHFWAAQAVIPTYSIEYLPVEKWVGMDCRLAEETGECSDVDMQGLITALLDTLFENMYEPTKLEYGEGLKHGTPSDLVQQTYFRRFEERLVETKRLIKIKLKLASLREETLDHLRLLARVVDESSILIGSLRCQAPGVQLRDLERSERFLEALTPPFLCLCHYDLHFGNIFVLRKKGTNFKLLDPNGRLYPRDIAYDLGKLRHSYNGKYDLIHRGFSYPQLQYNTSLKFELAEHTHVDKLEGKGGSGAKTGKPLDVETAKLRYSYINDSFWGWLTERIKTDPRYDWLVGDRTLKMRVAFNEALDFLTMLPFHLVGDDLREGDPQKCITLYLTGMKLLREFMETYGKEYVTSSTGHFKGGSGA